MERNFTNSDDFEDWLQGQSNSFRMRPSDKVWKAISKDLNKKRRRFFWGVGFSVLVLSAVGYFTIQHRRPVTEDMAGEMVQHTAAIPALNFRYNNQAPVIALNNSTTAGLTNEPLGIKIPDQSFRTSVGTARPEEWHKENITKTQHTTGTALTLFEPQPVDSYFNNLTEAEKQEVSAISSMASTTLPLSIESVVNSYRQPKYKRKRLSLQAYFTPAISYRKLTENKSYLRSAGAANNAAYYNPSVYDVNSLVVHKPAFGFEVGMAAKYPVARNIKLRAGAQLNINRYEMRAYDALPQMTTITLNEPDNKTSSIRAMSKYSNVDGTNEDWLQNFYAQVSVPVGAELNLFGNRNTRFGIATSIQPTYVIGNRSYVLSTDYKNYAAMPSLVRHWNVNTSLETYISYSSGKLAWQVGPQVRYQLMSSFISQYPVKENLFDFGLRVGVSLKK